MSWSCAWDFWEERWENFWEKRWENFGKRGGRILGREMGELWEKRCEKAMEMSPCESWAMLKPITSGVVLK